VASGVRGWGKTWIKAEGRVSISNWRGSQSPSVRGREGRSVWGLSDRGSKGGRREFDLFLYYARCVFHATRPHPDSTCMCNRNQSRRPFRVTYYDHLAMLGLAFLSACGTAVVAHKSRTPNQLEPPSRWRSHPFGKDARNLGPGGTSQSSAELSIPSKWEGHNETEGSNLRLLQHVLMVGDMQLHGMRIRENESQRPQKRKR
jgi:hypothetical protein